MSNTTNRLVSANYYPAFLSLTGKKCVVIGGGQVALRKVEALLACGAHVHVVSEDVCPEIARSAMDGRVALLKRSYRPGDLHGAFVAIAATDDRATNLLVAKEARGESALVNVVDDAEHSDFIVPSVINRGDITVAVSTAGRSPALARKIRARLEAEIGPEYAELAVVVGEVRAEVRRCGISVSADNWQDSLELDALLDLLKRGEREEARTMLLDGLTGRGRASGSRLQLDS